MLHLRRNGLPERAAELRDRRVKFIRQQSGFLGGGDRNSSRRKRFGEGLPSQQRTTLTKHVVSSSSSRRFAVDINCLQCHS